MTATKLTLYNGALLVLGERKLSAIDEARECRRVLDHIWDTGARDLALISGQWNFATRTVQVEYTSDVEPDFGFQRAFTKPTDWLRTVAMCGDGYFNAPLTALEYDDTAGYWWSDLDTIYVKYISNDTSYGTDLSLWPVNFARYFEALMAFEACERLTQSATKKKQIFDIMEERLLMAKNTDAMNEGTQFAPSGSWSRSRRGGSSSTRMGTGRYF